MFSYHILVIQYVLFTLHVCIHRVLNQILREVAEKENNKEILNFFHLKVTKALIQGNKIMMNVKTFVTLFTINNANFDTYLNV